jgi:hypothetical protein
MARVEMKVSQRRRREVAPALFDYDRPVESLGSARGIVGDFFDMLTASASGAERLRTDASCDYCPDLRLNPTTYYECKSVGNTGQVIIYKARLEKDARFLRATQFRLVYWIWRHRYAVAQAKSEAELRKGLADNILSVTIVRRPAIVAALKDKPVRVVNGAKGGDYHDGWCLAVSDLSSQCRHRAWIDAEAYGLSVRSVPAFVQQRWLSTLMQRQQRQGELF